VTVAESRVVLTTKRSQPAFRGKSPTVTKKKPPLPRKGEEARKRSGFSVLQRRHHQGAIAGRAGSDVRV
jgi:hypothetical protein